MTLKDTIDEHLVQIIAIICITVLGIVAMVIGGEMGNIIAIAIAGALGVIVGALFYKKAVGGA